MRRITFLITMGIERPSGQRYFNLARELVRQGDRVRILALHPDLQSCRTRRFVQDGVEIWYVGQMHSRKRDGVTLPMAPLELLQVLFSATLGMLWGIICSPAEIYHLGKPQPVNGLAALVGVCGLRWRRFWVDCDDDEVTSNRFSSAWQRRVFAFWQWLLPALAAGVTVNTYFLAGRMRQRAITPVVYVPNGFNPAVFQRPPEAILAGLRAALGLEGQRVVAYVGTIALHNHPVNLLLEGFRDHCLADPRLTLILVGGGEDLPVVRRWIVEHDLVGRIVCLGHVPPAVVALYTGLADITVDPVYDDIVAQARSPLKIFESMALGIPVVAGAVGDRPTLLAEGAAGIIVPAGDAAALGQALNDLLQNEPHRQRLAEAALSHVQQYTWQCLAATWTCGYNDKDHHRAL